MGGILPPDVTVEVLQRLPVKALFKFRCVCKSWRALISDPHFVKQYRNSNNNSMSKPRTLLLVCLTETGSKIPVFFSIDKDGHFVKKEFPAPMPGPAHLLRTSCLGLVCLQSGHKLILCNPTTEQWIPLPDNSPFHTNTFERKVLGLGYIPSTMEYKVVCMYARCMHDAAHHLDCEVLTVGTDNHWRVAANPPFSVSGNAPFAGGAIYTLPNYRIHAYGDGIARFDLAKEEWEVIRSPEQYFRPVRLLDLSLVGLRGSLCVANIDERNRHLDLWVLKDYNLGLWVKEVRIHFSYWYGWEKHLHIAPLDIEDDGRVLVEAPSGRIRYYDPESETFGYVVAWFHEYGSGIALPNVAWFHEYCGGFAQYVESFWYL